MWTFPPKEEKVNYMAQHASTEGKFSVRFFMGVLLSAEVPNASILTILNKHTVYDLLISWPLGCLHLTLIFQYFDSCFIDGQTKGKES